MARKFAFGWFQRLFDKKKSKFPYLRDKVSKDFTKLWNDWLPAKEITKEEEKLLVQAEKLLKSIFEGLRDLEVPTANALEDQKKIEGHLKVYDTGKKNMAKAQDLLIKSLAKLEPELKVLKKEEEEGSKLARQIEGEIVDLKGVVEELEQRESTSQKMAHEIRILWKELHRDSEDLEKVTRAWNVELKLENG